MSTTTNIRARLGFLAPLLPSAVDEPPRGEEWLHEIKYDGYRTLLIVDPQGVRAFSRRAVDWSDSYGPVCEAARELGCRSAIIDGEMIVQDETGRSDFGALRSAIRVSPDRLVFYAFDLLHLDGSDLRDRPIEDRRLLLRDLLNTGPGLPLAYSESFEGDGATFFAIATEMGLEGIVSKRRGSTYRGAGRSPDWLKTKAYEETIFEVIGAERTGRGAAVAVLAARDEDGLRYAGDARIVLPEPKMKAFWQAMEILATDKPIIQSLRRTSVQWARLGLAAQVRHLRGGPKVQAATLVNILASESD